MNKIVKWMDEDEYLFTKSMHAYIESRVIWDLKRLPKSVFLVKKKRYENPDYRYSNVSVAFTRIFVTIFYLIFDNYNVLFFIGSRKRTT